MKEFLIKTTFFIGVIAVLGIISTMAWHWIAFFKEPHSLLVLIFIGLAAFKISDLIDKVIK
mgnify:CR=1 FL=1